MASRMRLQRDFFVRDVLDVAPELLSKILTVRTKDNVTARYIITEIEAYRGIEDLACHASKGRTKRTEIMFHEGGYLYVYFVYGMYWMLNIVTGPAEVPQAILIRGLKNIVGPGRVTKSLGIDGSFYGEDLISSKRIWVEDSSIKPSFRTSPRIGVDYAGEFWKSRPWRFYIDVLTPNPIEGASNQ
jgi:DNA-3-methyladenine glycosylase